MIYSMASCSEAYTQKHTACVDMWRMGSGAVYMLAHEWVCMGWVRVGVGACRHMWMSMDGVRVCMGGSRWGMCGAQVGVGMGGYGCLSVCICALYVNYNCSR